MCSSAIGPSGCGSSPAPRGATTRTRRAGSSPDGRPSEPHVGWEPKPLVDRDAVARRLLILDESLRHIRERPPGDARSLASAPERRAALERWLQVAIEACIDVAYHVIADRGWTPPDTAREAFAALAAHGLLDADLAARLGLAAGLRNVLVHDYVSVDLERLVQALRNGLADLSAFGAAAARWLEETP